MSLLTHLNLNYLRIFLVVYRTRSMTQAAKELHLTQSGVSQQIKSLEETLNITLFDRVNRRIIPTSEAEILYRECSRRLDDLERALRQISNQDKELTGTIKIGLPPIFGQQVLVPMLSNFAAQHPLVNFELTIGLASEMTQHLLKGRLDFAFVDADSADSNLIYQEVAEQSLLMAFPASLKVSGSTTAKLDFNFFAQLPYISYTENHSMLNAWFQSNFGRSPAELKVRATIADCNTAFLFLRDGVGAALLPETFLQELPSTQNSAIKIIEQKPYKNVISVCRFEKRTLSLTADRCFSWLLDQLSTSKSVG